MKETTLRICEELFERYSSITVEKENILNAFSVLLNAYKNGKKLLVCGNGGSAADSEHIVGELMKQFKKPRKSSMKSLIVLKIAVKKVKCLLKL